MLCVCTRLENVENRIFCLVYLRAESVEHFFFCWPSRITENNYCFDLSANYWERTKLKTNTKFPNISTVFFRRVLKNVQRVEYFPTFPEISAEFFDAAKNNARSFVLNDPRAFFDASECVSKK